MLRPRPRVCVAFFRPPQARKLWFSSAECGLGSIGPWVISLPQKAAPPDEVGRPRVASCQQANPRVPGVSSGRVCLCSGIHTGDRALRRRGTENAMRHWGNYAR